MKASNETTKRQDPRTADTATRASCWEPKVLFDVENVTLWIESRLCALASVMVRLWRPEYNSGEA
jgi:hypothetical protein